MIADYLSAGLEIVVKISRLVVVMRWLLILSSWSSN